MMDRTSHGRPKKTKTMMIGRSEATSEQSDAQSPIQAGSLLFHCSPLTNMVKNTLGQTCPSSKLNTALRLAHMLTTPHREECMHEMDSSTPGAPTVMVVDAGDVFVGGRYHSLVPILRFGFLVLNYGTHNTRI